MSTTPVQARFWLRDDDMTASSLRGRQSIYLNHHLEDRRKICISKKTREKPTVVDDAILQKRLTQMNSFLWVSRLTNFHQPGHELAADEQKHTRAHITA